MVALNPHSFRVSLQHNTIGIGVKTADNDNLMHDSIRQWTRINGELLLNVFLPGLIFKDAVSLNFHLFTKALWQLLILAFPAVLGGAFLTALVAFYIFPYDWSFSLAMTFGAILTATDPVAVSALLDEVGAPPRLKTHIAGESLLNDGSAIVFYVIFSQRYLFELETEGYGQDFNIGEGFVLFFQESLGGVAVGIAFGLGLVGILYTLNRRYEQEENVVQVGASITTAYLCFYSADINKMSGVMAVVFCGITTRAVGTVMINDLELWENFWNIVEHLLNTLLFALGGAVWGTIIAPSDARTEAFAGKDWGYLIILYLLLNMIRFFLLFVCYPVTSRIGLKGDIKETFFAAFGGLRGAIGIALALSLDAEVREYTEMFSAGYEFRDETNKLFGMVGGISLLTLVVNGSLAGPLLHKLELSDSTDDRKRVVDSVQRRGVRRIQVEMMKLLTEPRFRNVDFASVKYHIPALRDFTLEDLKVALQTHKECCPPREYKAPHLKRVLPYLLKEGQKASDIEWLQEYKPRTFESSKSFLEKPKEEQMTSCDTKRLLELRQSFLTLLRATYNEQVDEGELDGRVGFVAVSLEEGVNFAADRVAKGEPLQDWKFSGFLTNSIENGVIAQYDRIATKFSQGRKKNEHVSVAHIELRMKIHRAAAFIKAHRNCQETFRQQMCEGDDEHSYVEQKVLHESQNQVKTAEDFLLSFDSIDVDAEMSHLFSIVLLNKAGTYIQQLLSAGILNQREAGQYSEEIEEELDVLLRYCPNSDHPGQLSTEEVDRAFRTGGNEKGAAEGSDDTA